MHTFYTLHPRPQLFYQAEFPLLDIQHLILKYNSIVFIQQPLEYSGPCRFCSLWCTEERSLTPSGSTLALQWFYLFQLLSIFNCLSYYSKFFYRSLDSIRFMGILFWKDMDLINQVCGKWLRQRLDGICFCYMHSLISFLISMIIIYPCFTLSQRHSSCMMQPLLNIFHSEPGNGLWKRKADAAFFHCKVSELLWCGVFLSLEDWICVSYFNLEEVITQ